MKVSSIFECQKMLEIERGISRVYLSTLADIAKLLGLEENDHDVISPIEALIKERDDLLKTLRQVEGSAHGNQFTGA